MRRLGMAVNMCAACVLYLGEEVGGRGFSETACGDQNNHGREQTSLPAV